MSATSFLTGGLEDEESPEAPPKLDHRDFQRSFVLLSSYRSGSHMLKLSLGRLANMACPPEPLNQYAESGNGYTLKEYLSDDLPRPVLMTEGAASVHHFLRHFYARMPEKRRVVLDIKYPQAFAFGVNADMDYPLPVPTFLDEANKLGMPIIHLTRRDKIAQAVSLLMAEGTGVYLTTKRPDADAEPTSKVRLLPRDVFNRALRFHNASENARSVLSAMRANVIEVTYETLTSGDWKGQYRRIFRFLDRYADIPAGFQPPTKPQDSSSRIANLEEIRAYAAERAPHLLGQ